MPFDQTTNLTSLFKPMSKPTTYNISWNFVDGTMFVNNNEFILYGYSDTESSYPLTMLTDVRGLINSYDEDLPAANWTLGYEQDQDGLESINWMPSFIQSSLPDGLTRFSGGVISAPSENLRFYFSGIYAQSWGTILDGQSAANALITVKMPTMSNQTWSNNTLPDNVPGRFNAELVWIPVSSVGCLDCHWWRTLFRCFGPKPDSRTSCTQCKFIWVQPFHSSPVYSASTGHRIKPVLPSCRPCPFMTLQITNGDSLILDAQMTFNDNDCNQVHATNVWWYSSSVDVVLFGHGSSCRQQLLQLYTFTEAMMALTPVNLPLMMSTSSRFRHSPGSKYILERVLMVAADINV